MLCNSTEIPIPPDPLIKRVDSHGVASCRFTRLHPSSNSSATLSTFVPCGVFVDRTPSSEADGRKNVGLLRYSGDFVCLVTVSLTVGSALGSFSSLFSKVKAIDAKHGRFELLLCAGDFFGFPSEEGDDSELDLLLAGKHDGKLQFLVKFNRCLNNCGKFQYPHTLCKAYILSHRKSSQRLRKMAVKCVPMSSF
jgi:hypothetical protein